MKFAEERRVRALDAKRAVLQCIRIDFHKNVAAEAQREHRRRDFFFASSSKFSNVSSAARGVAAAEQIAAAARQIASAIAK